MPSQYQRLSAHLHTNSLLFNRKLQDYIATQAAVRQSFFAQYNQPPFNTLGQGFSANATGQQSAQTMNNFVNQQMPPPQGFNQAPQTFNQQFYRTAPYSVPPRTQPHQRSASLSSPQQMSGYQQPTHFANSGVGTPQGEDQRRMSLPPQPADQTSFTLPQTSSRPSLSRSPTSQSALQVNASSQQMSPQHSNAGTTKTPSSTQSTPTLHTVPTPGDMTPTRQSNAVPSFADNLPDANLFSLSMPPESQQFIAQGLQPSDPMAAAFMQGSENIALPMTTYHYNPNLSPKSSRMVASGVSGTSTFDSTLLPSTYSNFSGDEFNKMNNMDSVHMANPSAVVSDDLFSPNDMTFSSEFSIYGTDMSLSNDNFDDLFNFDNES